MKYWAPLLHIYQPPTQEVEVLQRIDGECYKPLFEMLSNNPYARITLNINGVLLDLLNDHGLDDTVALLVDLVQRGIVEVIGTAKNHPLLPLIQDKEVTRQIQLNEKTNKKIFGEKWKHGGFFPPELAINNTVLKLVAFEGYHWILASGIACEKEWPYDVIYKTSQDLLVFFRDDMISNDISFFRLSAPQFVKRIKNLYDADDYYVITAMDGETFGHHRRDYETEFLERALVMAHEDEEISIKFISELVDDFPIDGPCKPKPSSWSTTPNDLEQNIPYPLWKHPNNPVHKVQYRMLRALDELINLCDENKWGVEKNGEFAEKYRTARYFYDRGLYSCPMWWASMRPSWDPTLIHKGANLMLLSALNAQLALISLKICEGDEIYDRFMDYHHRLMIELTKQTANLRNIRTY